jgi:hypothetical protein
MAPNWTANPPSSLRQTRAGIDAATPCRKRTVTRTSAPQRGGCWLWTYIPPRLMSRTQPVACLWSHETSTTQRMSTRRRLRRSCTSRPLTRVGLPLHAVRADFHQVEDLDSLACVPPIAADWPVGCRAIPLGKSEKLLAESSVTLFLAAPRHERQRGSKPGEG